MHQTADKKKNSAETPDIDKQEKYEIIYIKKNMKEKKIQANTKVLSSSAVTGNGFVSLVRRRLVEIPPLAPDVVRHVETKIQ